MATVDYGALLRVNGKFINYNKDFFSEIIYPEGDIPEHAQYGKSQERPVKGNYFVYAGDTTFMLAFYKRMFDVISDGKMIKSVWGTPFLSETFVINGVLITVSHLDKTHIVESKAPKVPTEPWNEYVKNNWQGATGKEHLWELENGAFYYRKYIRLAKRRHGCKPFKYLTDRYIAEWDYDGNHYEVIYGYGIDPQKDVWDSIKNEWNFTEKEKEIIDTWFDMEEKNHE